MKKRSPARIVLQIFRNMFGEKNVTGIAAIHHPLGDVDSRSSDVGLFVEVGNFVDRPAVNSHSNAKLRMTLQCLADFQRAKSWRFRTVAKNKRATVARR